MKAFKASEGAQTAGEDKEMPSEGAQTAGEDKEMASEDAPAAGEDMEDGPTATEASRLLQGRCPACFAGRKWGRSFNE